MSLCERVTVLSSGGVIAGGTPAEVVAAPEVIEAHLGDSAMADAPRPQPAPRQAPAAPPQASASAEEPASKEAAR